MRWAWGLARATILKSACSGTWAPLLIDRLNGPRLRGDVRGSTLCQGTVGQPRGVRLLSQT